MTTPETRAAIVARLADDHASEWTYRRAMHVLLDLPQHEAALFSSALSLYDAVSHELRGDVPVESFDLGGGA